MIRLMSDGELSRLEVLRDLDQRRLTTAAAGQLLGLERRQVFRLLKAYRTEGPSGLISKRRGCRSNRRKPEALRRAVLAMIREWYWDFGLTASSGKGGFINRGRGASASANWCRSTAASIGGSRTAGRNALCWCLSTMRPAG
jgi:hypothetical protein